jgi:hypothetical protein
VAYQEVRPIATLTDSNITEDSCSHKSRLHQIKSIEILFQTCEFFIFRSGVDVVAHSFLLAYNIPSLVSHSFSRPIQALKKKTLCRLETSATNYPVRLSHVPEQEILQCHTCFVFHSDSKHVARERYKNAAICIIISVSINCFVSCVFVAITDVVSVILLSQE